MSVSGCGGQVCVVDRHQPGGQRPVRLRPAALPGSAAAARVVLRLHLRGAEQGYGAYGQAATGGVLLHCAG